MSRSTQPLIRVRKSRVHGRGVFAARRIRKGTRIIEYLGDRVSHKEADRRYENHDVNDNHTFLFIVDRGVVIDAGIDGNDARFINHSCDPNCESVIENRRVFVEAIRTIEPGEELNYDYQIGRDPNDPPNVDEIYKCLCGAENCRGTMLWPPKRPKKRKKKRVAKQPAKRSTKQAVKRSTKQAVKRSTKRSSNQAAAKRSTRSRARSRK